MQEYDSNGFKTYETYCAVLMFLNNRRIYNQQRDLLTKANSHYTERAEVIAAFAKELKEFADRCYEVVFRALSQPGTTIWNDARDFIETVGSIWRVDWREVAEHLAAP